MNKYLLVIFGLVLIVGIISMNYADERNYVWTYEYQTMPEGLAEVEYYLTSEVPDSDQPELSTWKNWLELEYGITDRWDISMYQMFKQKNAVSEYDGFKIRTRYRFGEKDRFFVDPLFYLELIRGNDLSTPNVIEAKLILAKDFGSWNISFNHIVERNLEIKGETENEYAVGINYAILRNFRLGLESKGEYEGKVALGPSLAFYTNKFWLSLGTVAGLNNRSDDLQSRIILGFGF